MTVLLGLMLFTGGPRTPSSAEAGSSAWREAAPEEELEPGDLGSGTGDLEAEAAYHPRQVRRIPVTFSSLVLLLTLTIGVGMAAGLLAGPSPWNPGTHGANGSTSNNTDVLPPDLNQTTNNTPPPSHSSPYPNGSTNHTAPGPNSTGTNGTHVGPNSTNLTNRSSGPGPGNGTTNQTKGSHLPQNRSVVVYRNHLPWLPVDSRFLTIGAAALCLSGLAAAVLWESFRPPPVSGNPWLGPPLAHHRSRPRRPALPPHAALVVAIEALRAELLGYSRRAAATDDEVRDRIIRLYGALLAAISPGLGDLDGRTPREVEWLAVRYLGVASLTAHELTWLFEEARYSSHRLGPASVDRAQNALALLLRDLEDRSREL
jgi:hypothetical protein